MFKTLMRSILKTYKPAESGKSFKFYYFKFRTMVCEVSIEGGRLTADLFSIRREFGYSISPYRTSKFFSRGGGIDDICSTSEAQVAFARFFKNCHAITAKEYQKAM